MSSKLATTGGLFKRQIRRQNYEKPTCSFSNETVIYFTPKFYKNYCAGNAVHRVRLRAFFCRTKKRG
jgi:hypothetical protein